MTTNFAEPRGIYSRSEAARYLSCGVSTLDRLVAAKELQKLPGGKYARIDLDAYIERLRRRATA